MHADAAMSAPAMSPPEMATMMAPAPEPFEYASPDMGMAEGRGSGFQKNRGGVVSDAVQTMLAAAHGGDAGGPSVQEPVILREGSISGEVPLGRVPAALAALDAAVGALGGWVETSSSHTDAWLLQRWQAHFARLREGKDAPPPPDSIEAAAAAGSPTHAYVSLRIPSDAFVRARATIASALSDAGVGGHITAESSSARDVTEGYVDTLARVRTDEKALIALEALLAAAATVNEVLSVKREMDGISARLEGLKAQAKAVEGRARMGALSINVNAPEPPVEAPPPPPPAPPSWSPLRTLSTAFSALGAVGAGAIDVLVFALVFSVPVGVLLGGGVAAWRAASAAIVKRQGGEGSAGGGGTSGAPLLSHTSD